MQKAHTYVNDLVPREMNILIFGHGWLLLLLLLCCKALGSLQEGGVVLSNSEDRGKLSQSWVEGGAGREGWEDY